MSAARSPWQRFYEWAHHRRRRFWSPRAASLGRKTVSIGNLHWGGSGKTPTVIAAARGLADQGLRVAVLSRGYRRRDREPRVVSLGEGPLASVEQAGDEPVMLAEQAPGVVVAVGADRRAAASLALERAPDIEVFLLDDGFSHVRVRRDVEVLTFPAADPFAGGLLLPGGRLREPLGMVRLADAAVITGLEKGAEPPADFEPTLHRHRFAGRVFTSTLRSELLGGPSAERPLLVTGVARPERVARTAVAAGLECVDHLRFPDHHGYPPRSLRAIESAAARHRCDAVVVTSKDAVKLRGRLPAGAPPLQELSVEARLEPEFLRWLSDRLER
ncbi:MAG: tetraacyldisaccharide 4'-kinase [Acidobacteriota bacterium]|nr:tetraacyldisaccharide 4'-kinase [Acidobacteriota bacterium]